MEIDYYLKKNHNRPNRRFDIMEVLKMISNGTYRNEAEKVRNATTEKEKDGQKKIVWIGNSHNRNCEFQ